jgi:hypothetical protein
MIIAASFCATCRSAPDADERLSKPLAIPSPKVESAMTAATPTAMPRRVSRVRVFRRHRLLNASRILLPIAFHERVLVWQTHCRCLTVYTCWVSFWGKSRYRRKQESATSVSSHRWANQDDYLTGAVHTVYFYIRYAMVPARAE